MISLSHSPVTFTWNFTSSASASDLLRSSRYGVTGLPSKSLGRVRFGISRRAFTVSAKVRRGKKKHVYPWDDADPNPKTDGELLRAIHPFKPLKEKPKRVILEFEKPLIAFGKKIMEIKKLSNQSGLDLGDQMISLEHTYQKALTAAYKHLTPIQRVYIARHPQRPTCLDHIFNITDNMFLELHGDRHGYDDPAIVTGLGRINNKTYMFIGQQKGRNTKESIKRNFGMPTPHGYRKALRMMHFADHYGFPIVTFIDTPGAFADLKSEALNQGEAIAQNLITMFGLKVPIISIIIGEGGSGGALAIACANKLLMLENAVFYVASNYLKEEKNGLLTDFEATPPSSDIASRLPEACAAILYKSAKKAPKAAKKLRITATELCKLGIADGIIPEPLGGAHTDPYWTSQQIKSAILKTMDELTKMDVEELLKHRQLKFRNIGRVGEGVPIDPFKKRNMKKREAKEGFDFKKRNSDANESSTEHMSNKLSEAKNLSKKNKKECTLEQEFQVKSMDEEVDEESKDEGIDEEFFEESEDEGFNEESGDEGIDEVFFEESDDVLDKAEINREVNEECEDVLDQSEIIEKIKALTKEIEELGKAEINEETDEEFEDVLGQSEIDKNVKALKKEIEDSGASSLENLPQDLKDRLLQLKKSVSSELDDGVATYRVDHELPLSEFRERINAINHEIEHVFNNSPEVIVKVERLEQEAKKAGKRPDRETKIKLGQLDREIKQAVDEALKSSEKYAKLTADWPKPKVREAMPPDFDTIRRILVLKQQADQGMEEVLNSSEKYEELVAEISEVNVPSGGLDWSLEENMNHVDSNDDEFNWRRN